MKIVHPHNILLVDGLGETSDVSRPLKDGETAEWILLDGVCLDEAISLWLVLIIR